MGLTQRISIKDQLSSVWGLSYGVPVGHNLPHAFQSSCKSLRKMICHFKELVVICMLSTLSFMFPDPVTQWYSRGPEPLTCLCPMSLREGWCHFWVFPGSDITLLAWWWFFPSEGQEEGCPESRGPGNSLYNPYIVPQRYPTLGCQRSWRFGDAGVWERKGTHSDTVFQSSQHPQANYFL